MEKEKISNILQWIGCIIIAIVIALLVRYFIGTITIVRRNINVSNIRRWTKIMGK